MSISDYCVLIVQCTECDTDPEYYTSGVYEDTAKGLKLAKKFLTNATIGALEQDMMDDCFRFAIYRMPLNRTVREFVGYQSGKAIYSGKDVVKDNSEAKKL